MFRCCQKYIYPLSWKGSRGKISIYFNRDEGKEKESFSRSVDSNVPFFYFLSIFSSIFIIEPATSSAPISDHSSPVYIHFRWPSCRQEISWRNRNNKKKPNILARNPINPEMGRKSLLVYTQKKRKTKKTISFGRIEKEVIIDMHDCLFPALLAGHSFYSSPHLIGSRRESVGRKMSVLRSRRDLKKKCSAALTDRLKHFLHLGPAQSGFSSSSRNLLLLCSLSLFSFSLFSFSFFFHYYKWAGGFRQEHSGYMDFGARGLVKRGKKTACQ